jgi:hypothetical protein
MPISKRLFDLEDGTKVWVRQASGLEKLKIESAHATAMRKCRHFGNDINLWTMEQQDEFWAIVEELGGGMSDQIQQLIPMCVIGMEDGEPCDVNLLTTTEIVPMLEFIRGDDAEDAVPLVSPSKP